MTMKLQPTTRNRPAVGKLISAASVLALAVPLALAESPPQPPATPATDASAASAPAAATDDTAADTAPATGATPATSEKPMEAVDLEGLLGGVEHQCRYNEMLEQFWRNLGNPEKALGVLHPGLRQAVGTISVNDQLEFRMYSIPVHGSWHEVPVRQIQFGLGKGNGIHVLLVEFADSTTQATEVFTPLIKRSKIAMDQDPENTLEATTDLVVDDGKALLICDLST